MELTKEHINWLKDQCNQLIYNYPCTTRDCVMRQRRLGTETPTCLPFEIYQSIVKEKSSGID